MSLLEIRGDDPIADPVAVAIWSTSQVEVAAALASSHVAGKIGEGKTWWLHSRWRRPPHRRHPSPPSQRLEFAVEERSEHGWGETRVTGRAPPPESVHNVSAGDQRRRPHCRSRCRRHLEYVASGGRSCPGFVACRRENRGGENVVAALPLEETTAPSTPVTSVAAPGVRRRREKRAWLGRNKSDGEVRNTPQILEPKIDALTFAMDRALRLRVYLCGNGLYASVVGHHVSMWLGFYASMIGHSLPLWYDLGENIENSNKATSERLQALSDKIVDLERKVSRVNPALREEVTALKAEMPTG
nr:hypothetical protein Iba_chr11bCG12740 [Ipomoea batatas]